MSDTDGAAVHFRNREKSGGSSSVKNGSSKNKKDIKNGGDYVKDGLLSGQKMKRVVAPPRSKRIYLIGAFVLSLVVWALLFSGPSAPSHSVGWWDENVYLRFGLQKQTYAVVLDAGSTGTRVLAFAFHQSVKGKSIPKKNSIIIYLNCFF